MKIKLHTQYQLLITIILVCALISITSVMMRFSNKASFEVRDKTGIVMEEYMMQQVEDRGLVIVRSLASNLVNPLYNYEMESIYRLLANILSSDDVMSVVVFDEAGKILHDGTKEIKDYGRSIGNYFNTLKPKFIEGYHVEINPGNITIYHRIMIGDMFLGGVKLVLSLEDVYAKIDAMDQNLVLINDKAKATQIITVLIATLVSVLCSLVIGTLVARYLVSPIKTLVKAAKRIGSGNYALNLDLKRKDEIGELAEAFNAMAANIKAHQKEVQHIAYHDSLTQLPNRLKMRQILNQSIEDTIDGSGKSNTVMALMIIDLDDFKQVNDTLGHDAGDLMLQQVAVRIAQAVRGHNDIVVKRERCEHTENKMISRLGGDEFTVLVTGLPRGRAAGSIATRIIESLQVPYLINDKVAIIGSSIGIAICPRDGRHAEELIKNADMAMYQAKYDGKNTFAFYDKSMGRRLERARRVKEELLNGLEHNEFQLYFQPQIRLKDDVLVGCEALIRWLHPEKGLLFPNTFIPVAEESGLIKKVDEWVLEAACKQLSHWQETQSRCPHLAVNLSPQQLTDEQLAGKLKALMDKYGVNPENLHLEITETMLIKDETSTISVLDKLSAMGCPIWLDDFGTGFSSLSHLQLFPLSGIKIDRKFIMDLETNHHNRKLAGALVALGQMLGLEVIAEGAEKKNQVDFLRGLDCPYVQGYFFHKPMSALQFQELLGSIETERHQEI